MGPLREIIKPSAGFSHIIHVTLTCIIPIVIFVLARLGFLQLQIGLLIITLSKWRMFAVKPRHWPAYIRANAVDIIVGVSVVVFIMQGDSHMTQLAWSFVYGLWLLWLKPMSTGLGVALQALMAQSFGVAGLMLAWGDAPSLSLIAGTWLISYLSARHFFANFEEPMIRYLSLAWAYVSAAVVWVLSHWLLFYGPVAQPALLLSVLSFGMGGIYYLEKNDRMSTILRRQIVFVVFAIIVIVLTFSDWGDKVV